MAGTLKILMMKRLREHWPHEKFIKERLENLYYKIKGVTYCILINEVKFGRRPFGAAPRAIFIVLDRTKVT